MTKLNLLQSYCEKAIGQLLREDVKKFNETTREDERIKIMNKYVEAIPINLVENGKSYELAEAEKTKGNKLFAGKKYEEAVKSYNRGIILCPQDTEAERELLTIIISNRSATFFELEEYRKVFDDIDYVLAVGSYPQCLHYKIWLRKAKSYDALQNQRSANEAYDLAISSLKHAGLDEEALTKKKHEIENARSNPHTKKCEKSPEIAPVSNSDLFTGGNAEYKSAHKNVHFDFDPLLGRYARAVEDFDTGVIIVEEAPHCAVLSYENSLTNCQYCCASIGQAIACPTCAHAVFCSLNCERQANAAFHKYECALLPVLHQIEASVNCQLAIRIITQKSFQYFQQKQKMLKDFLKDNCKKAQIKQGDDYIRAFSLCRNEHLRKEGELLHYSAMSIVMMRLLKFARYFAKQNDDAIEYDEVFIGSLILRHLQILQYNSHEISEIRACKEATVDGIEINYKNEYIGAALYSTLALFNHSCDPSIVRYNIGNRIVVRTIKPIKAGDIIYENYGPIYTSTPIEERKIFLQERYRFECYCKPCQDEWPSFDNMNPNQIRIGCQTEKCPFEFTLHKDDFQPYIECDYCNTTIKVFPLLRGLTELEILLPRAEQFYSVGEDREALKLFTKSLDILYKYSRPPCPDMVKIQQRLRTLYLHLGNKQFGYQINKL